MNKLLTLALVALAIVACSKEGTDKGINPEEGVNTYAGVNISFPQTDTKATDANATAVETAVTKIGVYIVDNTSGLMHSGLYSASDFEKDASSGNYKLKTALQTTTGEKTIYVVLNPTDKLNATIVAAGKNSFNGVVPIVGETFVNKSGNTIESLTMSSVAGGTKQTVTAQDKATAIANPFAVTVERNTAKVTLRFGASHTVIGGTVSDVQYGIDIAPKQSYLIQNLKAVAAASIENVNTPANKVAIPDPSLATADYVAYMQKFFTDSKQIPTDMTDVQAHNTAAGSLVGFYCPENVNVKNYQDNTTAVIIKATYTPTTGTAITGYDTATGVTTLGDIAMGSSFYKYKTDGTLWSEAAYNAATTAGATYSKTAADFTTIYTNGVCYYRIWVMGENTTGPGAVGVLRNNFYVMNITKINGVGTPGHPGADSKPGDQIETQCLISVNVAMQPWTMVESNHEI